MQIRGQLWGISSLLPIEAGAVLFLLITLIQAILLFPQPEWRVESRTESPGMSLLSGRGSATRSPSHALQRGASPGPLVYDHPPRTCHYSPSERCKKKSQRLKSRLEKPLLWKWAADDVTLWYPITWFLANLCIKLV